MWIESALPYAGILIRGRNHLPLEQEAKASNDIFLNIKEKNPP